MVNVFNVAETTMPPSKRSEQEQSQFKAQEVTARKPSSSSLFRGLPTSRRTWRSSTKSERRTKDLHPRQLKPKLAPRKQTSERTVEMMLRDYHCDYETTLAMDTYASLHRLIDSAYRESTHSQLLNSV